MNGKGSHVANITAMENEQKSVRLVRQYDRPEFATKPTLEDTKRDKRVELQYYKREVRRQRDQIRRLREEIEDTIKMLVAALQEGKEETIGQIERRLSRLKGALAYVGSDDYGGR